MAEYIDKSDTETVFREIRKRLSAKKKDYEAIEFLIKYQMLSVAEEVIHAIPAADVVPVESYNELAEQVNTLAGKLIKIREIAGCRNE